MMVMVEGQGAECECGVDQRFQSDIILPSKFCDESIKKRGKRNISST